MSESCIVQLNKSCFFSSTDLLLVKGRDRLGMVVELKVQKSVKSFVIHQLIQSAEEMLFFSSICFLKFIRRLFFSTCLYMCNQFVDYLLHVLSVLGQIPSATSPRHLPQQQFPQQPISPTLTSPVTNFPNSNFPNTNFPSH